MRHEIKTLSRYYEFSFSGIIGILLLVFFVISKANLLPDIVSGILALSWILYVPLGVGRAIDNIPIRFASDLANRFSSSVVAGLIIRWFLGLFIILFVLLLTFYAHFPIAYALGPGLLVLSIFSNLVAAKNHKSLSIKYPQFIRILTVALIMGLSFAMYVRSYSPYPLTPGLDTFTHIYVIKTILEADPTRTPLVYVPTLDALIALGSATFPGTLEGIFWLGTFLVSSLFAISIFVLSYWATKNYVHAIISTVIGLFVTEQALVANLQFLFPSSFVMSVFPIILVIINSVWREKSISKIYRVGFVFVPFVGLILFHFQLGLVASLIIVFYLIIAYIAAKNRIALLSIRIMTISLAVVLLLYYNGYITSQLTLNLIDGQYSYFTPTKIKHLKEWYTDEIIMVSLFGLIASALFKDRKVVLLGFIASIMLVIYFQKIDWIHRYITLERPLLSFASALLLTSPLVFFGEKLVLSFLKFMFTRNFDRAATVSLNIRDGTLRHLENLISWLVLPDQIRKSSMVYLFIVILLIFPTLMRPYDIYLEPYRKNGYYFANYSYEELDAAKWIARNTPTDYLVFSDTFTVVEMRGLAYRENIEGISWNATVVSQVKSILTSNNAAEAYGDIVHSYGDKTLIVITPRTSIWLKGPDQYVQFPTLKFESFVGFDKFFDKDYFALKYQSGGIFVFEPVSR